MTALPARSRGGAALERRILQAFRQALSEERPQVAEHLLRALEALEPATGAKSAAFEAYAAILDRTVEGAVVGTDPR